MSRCEDFPCCGHKDGECPSYNKFGQELCWDCNKEPSRQSGRCFKCFVEWQRYQRSFDYDLTGQDQEADQCY